MTTTTRRPVAIIATSISALALTACGSSAVPSAARTTSPKPSAASTIPAGNNGQLTHPIGAIADLSKFSCKANSAGSWSASGVVTNSSTTTRQFILDISVVNKSDTVVGSIRRQFLVAARHRVSADAKDFYRSTSRGLRCLPRLVSGGK